MQGVVHSNDLKEAVFVVLFTIYTADIALRAAGSTASFPGVTAGKERPDASSSVVSERGIRVAWTSTHSKADER